MKIELSEEVMTLLEAIRDELRDLNERLSKNV